MENVDNNRLVYTLYSDSVQISIKDETEIVDICSLTVPISMIEEIHKEYEKNKGDKDFMAMDSISKKIASMVTSHMLPLLALYNEPYQNALWKAYQESDNKDLDIVFSKVDADDILYDAFINSVKPDDIKISQTIYRLDNDILEKIIEDQIKNNKRTPLSYLYELTDKKYKEVNDLFYNNGLVAFNPSPEACKNIQEEIISILKQDIRLNKVWKPIIIDNTISDMELNGSYNYVNGITMDNGIFIQALNNVAPYYLQKTVMSKIEDIINDMMREDKFGWDECPLGYGLYFPDNEMPDELNQMFELLYRLETNDYNSTLSAKDIPMRLGVNFVFYNSDVPLYGDLRYDADVISEINPDDEKYYSFHIDDDNVEKMRKYIKEYEEEKEIPLD